ncbi:4-hydroxy-3-methylbut-2-enyl diphosphate reductase [gamma proteobacterium HTCC5015]|nr:4-hydroxy-3-methylbut-2-enyl diphosphate reductase [gamma proteobacterium HTCC5015]
MTQRLNNATIYLANPRGFCAGVDRAIDIVERALEHFPPPIYVRHEVVHNKYVVDDLREKGAIFVEELHEVPDDSTVIFSAHGVSRAVEEEAERRGLQVFDATCPLVTKVHMEVARYSKKNKEVIMIGHEGHPEVEGTMGRYIKSGGKGEMYLVESPEDVLALEVNDPDNLAFVTQTTLSMDDTSEVIEALQRKFPKLDSPRKEDICYATQNRQDAIKSMVKQCDLLLVVGSKNSSNSKRLVEIGLKNGVDSYLVDNKSEIDPDWLEGKRSVGLSSGASAPEVLVREVLDYLKAEGAVVEDGLYRAPEGVTFSLPIELRDSRLKARL